MSEHRQSETVVVVNSLTVDHKDGI